MACAYTTRKKDEASGAAAEARVLSARLSSAAERCLQLADEDAEAYLSLQRTWKKDSGLEPAAVLAIQEAALNVPVTLLQECHANAKEVHAFMTKCNPNIISDAKVAIHLLAGGGRAAYQTILVNSPNAEVKSSVEALVRDLHALEATLLPPVDPVPAAPTASAATPVPAQPASAPAPK